MREKFELTILGSNSAMPAYGRWPTSQILSVANQLILIDCGEGCQMRMLEYKIKRSKISHVLISHLHGDHVYGLPGFVGSLAHLSRKDPLHIYGPVGIKEYAEVILRLSESYTPFELVIHELNNTECSVIVDHNRYTIEAFPVSHRIPTFGFLIKEKQAQKNIRVEAIKEYALTIEEIKQAKRGQDIMKSGEPIANIKLTLPLAEPRSYAYCADTSIMGWEKGHLKGVNLMYFETTYLHELVDLAHERKHSTAKEAGELAAQLEVGQLVIGHYSSRYNKIDALIEEAKSVFEKTHGGYDGFMLNID